VLFQVVLPLAKPPIASYAAVTFLTAWNMYIWPLMVGNTENLKVATVQLAPLIAGGTGFYGKIPPNVTYAAALLSALPVTLFFLWAQRWFINAIAGTGNDS
jgi:ABC-type glycerol-3-phosphate transport system permease component